MRIPRGAGRVKDLPRRKAAARRLSRPCSSKYAAGLGATKPDREACSKAPYRKQRREGVPVRRCYITACALWHVRRVARPERVLTDEQREALRYQKELEAKKGLA